MIYQSVNTSAPIRQGDIFASVPRVEFSLEEVLEWADDGLRQVPWKEVAASADPRLFVVPVRPVTAIVISQDCDASRARDLSLCEIGLFRDVEGKARDASSAKSWMKMITQHAKVNLKWFYLPPDPSVGFKEKMAVDFATVTRIARSDLVNHIALRVGRLNELAYQHFRERLAEFYRRYPLDEWYSLDAGELSEYQKLYPGTEKYPWQHGETDQAV